MAMGTFAKASMAVIALTWPAFFHGLLVTVYANADFDYKDALGKSIIFLEAQRSGRLPPRHRPAWRGDSGLEDGKQANVDLVGGYYDAGDNVKYGLPMAFTISTMSLSALYYHQELKSAGELQNVMDAIRWGTDYFLKTSSRKNKLYVQVGDPVQDHQCWVRPEEMKTPRTVLMIDSKTPGTEIAAETAAAMASASIVFRGVDRPYSRRLLNKAKLLFHFANSHKGTYDGECPFYCSYSGYNDELLWAATWLYMATRNPTYLEYIKEDSISAIVAEFSWDLKYAGAQILLSEMFFESGDQALANFKNQADSYVCSVLPESPYHQVYMTPGGLIHYRDGANAQYVTGTALLFSIYADVLAKHNQKITCGGQQFGSSQLMAFAKKQMDYLLGANPRGRSYMVGFGKDPPTRAHHRGASVPLENVNSGVSCPMSFVNFFLKNMPNPNELTGAIVGGPDKHDNFNDERWDGPMTEPCTYVNSLAIGVLAKLTSHPLSN
ncbi:hypothetical protein AB3S75_018048 [Citrus x aurantiifolia]